jgi:signal peptidase I
LNKQNNDTKKPGPQEAATQATAGQSSAAGRRSEKAGVFHFTKDMISALVMALIFIIYVIQAFKIPTGSMEKSLLIGDFLLGLKFIYGAPVAPYLYTKFPGFTDPKPGDVIIFKYPGPEKKDYIKRCVAGPGQTIRIEDMTVNVDGKDLILPPKGQYIRSGMLDPQIRSFAPLRIPRKGDTLPCPPEMDARQFIFYKHLIHQENPRSAVTCKVQLYINGEFSNSLRIIPINGMYHSFNELDFNRFFNWVDIDNIEKDVKQQFAGKNVEVKKLILINNTLLRSYVCKFDNYFMMGDNRDNSTDSRYWGFLNRNFVKAKAFILYFSLDSETPLWQLPLKIRWNRIGKLIKSWDGLTEGKK